MWFIDTMKLYAILAVLAIFFLADCTSSYGPSTTTVTKQTPVMQANVDITSSGFDAQTVTVLKGGTVTWTNRGSSTARVASAVHPTHNAYPIGGGCVGSTFDTCRNINPGESWSFTFSEVGSWKYHNHLNPSQTGTVNVVAG